MRVFYQVHSIINSYNEVSAFTAILFPCFSSKKTHTIEAWWLFAETWNAVDLYLTSKPPSYDGRNEIMPTDFLPEATGRTAQYLADLIQEVGFSSG